MTHIWMFEEQPAQSNDVLTTTALDHIEQHKYVSGEYTWLDNLCNPFWNAAVEYLPLWLAPNLVTLGGALHCLVSYVLTWYYAPQGVEAVPAWVLIFNGYCLFAAYTLDCLDGKQARRTGSSTPLGQLLDHGLDSLCLLAHVAAIQAWLRAGDTLMLQMILQFSFYMAQWEEYYTRILPHATGPIGVTEVNYFMALISVWHGTIWREASTNPAGGIYDSPILDDVNYLFEQGFLSHRFVDLILDFLPLSFSDNVAKVDRLSVLLDGWDRNHCVLLSWSSTMSFFCLLSIGRVYCHLKSWRNFTSSLLQLTSPFLIVWMGSANEFAFFNHTPEIAETVRVTIHWKSLAIGLLYCHITIKVIVFSMARQAVAVIQWDLLPLVAALWLTLFDPRLTPAGHVLLWQVLSCFWGYRLLAWNAAAARQICERLDIFVWSIKKTKKD